MLDPGTIEAFGLHVARSSALVVASPLLGSGAEMSGYKVALIVALAVVSYSTVGAPLTTDPDTLTFAFLALRELLIGAALGFCLHVVLTGLRVGTEMVSQEMAFSLAGTVDPVTGNTNPPVTFLYEVLFYLALLAVNGHHWLVRSLAESFERAPVGELPIGETLPGVVVELFAQLFAAGIAIAAPVLVLLFTVSALIGILARAVPHINVLEFGFNLRIVTGLVGLALFAPALEPAFGQLLEHFMHSLEAGLDALEV